ncbi:MULTISPECIES: acetyl-CoA C-acetyltransferase [unclassified Rhodococcus (in: high G+C Gram-positive bacteria)]|uniref:acetyl-CoA C-acetyltransferase n=1 Tax=unclassified Rhodococcus (in: high G+C Gram-positive bacteria) TaxID=192944 RepID=UPI0007BB55D2|nr:MULTISPECIES: acetyl-CoA C-acetyltransferase [unclassified Rhodococcus (in: high G+C Gram-positive bacteria)]KZF00962.1 acetyl-CoA acetyltransferase [Rhodococcus sp. EPR-147]KZF02350.1 acetyl-CoA acetyltransferase [Rhodococcus sp. EPR-279]MDV7990846.1 acetyl-CoA C-acetyltransferase [Rhodococcus sp. IEGM 1374]OZE22089.1 acetyl-CoA acetyltransferase [Rhodococcus sp. 05-2254-6]OZE35544.1 acetyl-CoA acetyltransferase [Rhodococcus sp. 05-2254-4]
MPDAVICEPLRTPVGRFGGQFRDISAQALAATVIAELVARTGISGADIDDVILGQASPNGDAPAIGRIAALDADLGIDVPGMQVDRRCGSGLQAVLQACMQVQSGGNDLVLAGGVESMSQTEFYATGMRWGVKAEAVALSDRLARARVTAGGKNFPVPGGMIETAENLRAEFSIARADQDALAVQSHQRAVAAQNSGVFAEEIVGVSVPQRKSDPILVTTDEHPRADTTLESLAKLKAIRASIDPESTVTAGNASGQNDGAAIAIVTTPEKAAALGLRPLARLAGWGVAGVAPRTMGIGPVPASEKALGRLGLSLDDMGIIELNEAFAAQALAVTRSWGIESDDPRLNPHGSGISLGHPVGATGARILATLLREMDRREVRYGLETMCIGGGQGLAAVFERIG